MDGKIINEALAEIVNLASAAMVADDVKVKEQAVADIVDEIRAVMPALIPAADDAKAAPAIVGCPSLRPMPISLPSGCDGVEPAETELRIASRKCVRNAISYADGYVVKMTKQGRALVGVVEQVNCEWHGFVYEGEDVILEVNSATKGKCFVSEAMRGAMNDAIRMLTHRRRYRENLKAKKAVEE